jgi:ABC-type Fe3+/spermidine/putrescine transport system ATPase subunit
MNVHNNIAFGLEMLNLSKEEVTNKVESILKLMGLEGFDKRDVNELSGGEQQRVALARSIVPGPDLLMLDEPLGSLDRALRERLLKDLTKILRSASQTTIYVTHDQEEAFSIADRIVVMNKGKVAQIGAPAQIFNYPANVFVARFIGLKNIYRIEVVDNFIDLPVGKVSVDQSCKGIVNALIRPDGFSLKPDHENKFNGKLIGVQFKGEVTKIEIAVGEQVVSADFMSADQLPKIGADFTLYYDPIKSVQIIDSVF